VLLFRVIDAAYPPVSASLYSYVFTSSTISFQVATLIVFFPVYLVLLHVIQKLYVTDPTRRESRIRRGLIYLTLFISGFTMAGDLVTVIYSFLNGDDLTAGFILKALSVLVVFGCVFFYYLQDVRSKLTPSLRNNLRILAIILVIGSVVWGFSVVGSPRTQKHQKLDSQRISDLQGLQSQIISSYQSKGVLPASLQGIKDSLSYYTIPKDPETGADYEYTATGPMAFRLCATFDANPPKNGVRSPYGYGNGTGSDNWQYQAGHYCFDRTIDPQLYPVYNYPTPPGKLPM